MKSHETPIFMSTNSAVKNYSSKVANESSSDHGSGPSSIFAQEGVTYSWNNLNVSAETRNLWGRKISETHILKDVSGICHRGELLAILGSSGAGKTTLLNVLTYRSGNNLKINGDMRINGKKPDPDSLMGISAYVQQVDLFSRVFTVREQLAFHAQLRIGKTVSEAERNSRVEQVLKELNLSKCADNLIGDPGRIKGISGGEKKRLAFACELITNPLLLLCDEPTSGIDSFMSQSVMNVMKQMTRMGKTVIATIHQPSSEIFHMFDHLQILAEGRVAFSGTRDEAQRFFNRIDRPCPQKFNPADHYIHTLAVKAGTEVQDRSYINEVCNEFRNTEGIALEQLIRNSNTSLTLNNRSVEKLNGSNLSKGPYRASYANQFSALMRRSIYEVIREPGVMIVKFGQMAFFALMFGLIYYQQDPTTLIGIQNIVGVLFIFVTNLSFALLFPVITLFSSDMPLFLREHWNGLYRSDVYFLTRNLVEFPLNIILPITSISISYYMVGLRPEVLYFLRAVGIMIIIGNTAISYGYMISCLAKDYNNAILLSTPLTLPLMFFGGFYVQLDSIPVYLNWMKYISWFMYGFEALSINQWDGYDVFPNVTIPVEKLILTKFGFDSDDFVNDLWIMFGLILIFRILAYFLLLSKTYRDK